MAEQTEIFSRNALRDDDAVAAAAASDHPVGEVNLEGEPVVDLGPRSSPFEEGETALAYFKGFLYLAKIKKVECDENGWRYSSTILWDEWVRINRLMKDAEENRKKLLKHKKTSESENKKKLLKRKKANYMETNTNTGSELKASDGPKEEKQKNAAQKEKGVESAENHITITIPPSLRKQLLDDWESVAQSDKLVKLRRSPNVDETFSKYRDYRQKKETRLADPVEELLDWFQRYFDKALPLLLLYQNERRQYEETIVNDVAPSAVYGAEHLLRLFVKLPEMLQNADVEEKHLKLFQQNVVDLIKFIQKNQSSFFLGAQQSSSEELDSSDKQDD